MAMAEVGIIMGSRSDWETMRHAAEMLDALEIAYETKVVSAHRTPDRLYDYARNAAGARPQGDRRRRRRRGASAGHGGVDDPAAGARRAGPRPRRSTASTASSPSPRCRPECRSGRWRSARPARPMPACSPPRSWRSSDEALAGAARRLAAGGRPTASPKRLNEHLAPGSTIGIVGGGQLGRMLAMAAARLGYECHVYAPDEAPPAAEVAAALHPRRLGRRGEARRASAARSTSPPTSSRISPPPPLAALAAEAPLHPPAAALAMAQDRLSEKSFIAGLGGRPRALRAVDDLAGPRRGAGGGRHARRC